MAAKLTLKEFIDRANKIHGNKYDYSRFIYINSKTKGIIICKKHGEFKQEPGSHICKIKKRGCTACGGSEKLTTEKFIIRAKAIHGNEYDYSKFIYKNNNTKGTIICRIHGRFKQAPTNHIYYNKNGCPNCCFNKKLTLKNFLSRAKESHGNKYNYSKFKYVNIDTKGIIICSKHGEFEQSPDKHINSKHGCPNCSTNISKLEIEWLDYLNIDEKYRNKDIVVNGKIFKPDAIINKTIYEFYGDFWHGNPKIYKSNDINRANKTSYEELYRKTMEREEILKQAGFTIISIWESEWNQIKSRQDQKDLDGFEAA